MRNKIEFAKDMLSIFAVVSSVILYKKLLHLHEQIFCMYSEDFSKTEINLGKEFKLWFFRTIFSCFTLDMVTIMEL